MAHEVRNLLRPHLASLSAYKPIEPFEVLSRRLGRPPHEIIKLDANENPYGVLPGVAEALAEYPFYHVYPDPQQSELREALALRLGVEAAEIIPGHGADELLDYLCRLLLGPGDGIVNLPPTFGMYGFDAALQGAKVHSVWRDENYRVNVEGIEALWEGDDRDRLKILFLTSPNNPSGTWLPDGDLTRLLRLPLLVVLDEAYVEFADGSSRASWVSQNENLVVLRTFSKAAGIAGLRLGYGIFPEWLRQKLWTFKQPYNVNVAATVAALVSLQQAGKMDEVVELIRGERNRLYAGLREVSYLEPVAGSQGNFILCRVVGREAGGLKQSLEDEGILVRYYDTPGLDNCIRISIGRPEQSERLLSVLHKI